MIKKQLSAFLCFVLLFALPITSLASPLDEVKDYVESYYVGEIDGDIQKATSIDEVINALDPYSTYFTEEEFHKFLNAVDMTTVGIGVAIQKADNGILITEVFDGGGAKSAGIVAGDVITAVDGKSTVSLSTEEASSRITGEENTSVQITVLKESGQSETKTIVRKAFSLPNVTEKLLYGRIGYISLSSFSNDTVRLISDAVVSLEKQGATQFILDLQDNGGGYVTASEQLIGMFPNAKNAYKLKEASGTITAPALEQFIQFPAEHTKVLINKNSASSSEMTAAALLDQQAAILYGQKSYGKGSMQSFLELSDGSYLKLTTGVFKGPNNTSINNVGIQPQVATTDNPLYKAHYDTILEQFPMYKEKASLTNVATSKEFTINFTHAVSPKVSTDKVHLVALGGDDVAISVDTRDNKLFVTPKEALVPGQPYALILHPGIENANAKTTKKGYILYVTVQK